MEGRANRKPLIVRRIVLTATLLALVLTACDTEKRRLQARIADLERQHAVLTQRVESRRNALRETEHRLDEIRAALAEHNTDVHAFIAQHHAAATCIRAASITLGEDNEYSAQLAGVARFGAIVCAIAVLNPRFSQEVTDVATRLEEADRRARDLKDQTADIERTLDAYRSRIREDETALDPIASDLADGRHQLSLR
jgi:predicted  nucleic acid-binding Zn-ribbon protein